MRPQGEYCSDGFKMNGSEGVMMGHASSEVMLLRAVTVTVTMWHRPSDSESEFAHQAPKPEFFPFADSCHSLRTTEPP